MNTLSEWCWNIQQSMSQQSTIEITPIAILGIFLVVITLIFLSGMFSSSETALSVVSISDIKNIIKNSKGRKKKKAQNVLLLLNDFNGTISAILIANNLVNIINTSLVTFLFSSLFGASGVLYGTIIMTVSIVIFSEILPKIFAKKHAITFSLQLSGIIKSIYYVTYPINALFRKVVKDDDYLTINSSKILLKEIDYLNDEGALSIDKTMWLRNVIKLDITQAKDIMTPMNKVFHIHGDTTNKEFLDLFLKTKASRYPVFTKNHMKVIGIVNIKDYFSELITNKNVYWKDLMYDAITFAKSTKLSIILDELQEQRQYFCIVTKSNTDKTAIGIITIEDIMEEIIGEVYDLNDSLEDDVHPVGHNSIIVYEKTLIKLLFTKYLKDIKTPLKLTSKTTFGQWMKNYFKIIDFQIGNHYSYQNLSIWIKKGDKNNSLIFEIDIHKKDIK